MPVRGQEVQVRPEDLGFQYSIGDAGVAIPGACLPRLVRRFQYSIGDAEVIRPLMEGYDIPVPFQYSIGDAVVKRISSVLQFTASFQYSVGDAGGSCVWFCGFLSFCVGSV